MFNRKNIRFYIVTFIAGLMAVGMIYQQGFAGDLKGRDFVRIGKVSTLEGSLIKLNAEEWALKVGDITYALHMGPSSFRDYHKFVMEENSIARVKGSVHNTDVGVMEIETEGQSITLRDETGRPAWAGTSFSKKASRPADNKGFGSLGNLPDMK